METEALDDALTVFAATAPDYGPLGLANHGPMAAEALAHLGRPDAIAGWVARYRTPPRRRPPRGPARCPRRSGRPRSGRPERFPEWLALFEREMADRPAAAVVGEWAPRLLPGTVGAATHGLIRTGHARARAGRGRHAAPAARGGERPGLLGRELPGAAGTAAADRARRAWPRRWPTCPTFPRTRRAAVLISDRVAAVADIADEFEQAVASLGWTGGAVDLLDELAAGASARTVCAKLFRSTGIVCLWLLS